MIRFEPDTTAEAFLRFFAMAVPSGNVYVEIAAPDIRFAAIVLLALAALAFRKRLAADPRAVLALLAFLLVSVPPWLMTSGNGRYYIPMLLCAGPLAVALIYLLPLTRWFRSFLAVAVLACQTFVVATNSPWDAWAWLPWQDSPYFHITAPKAAASAPPTTFVTLSSISYSLIAPAFPPSSRWMNVARTGAVGRDARWAQDFLDAAQGPIMVVVPSIRGEVGLDGKPNRQVMDALDVLLRPHRLALEGSACELLPSSGIAAITEKLKATPAEISVGGFWMCSLRYPVTAPEVKEQPFPQATQAVFERIEQHCTRFFLPGTARSMRINGGVLRHYPESDMKIYVLDDGTVLYKFWRALNAVKVGTVEGVLTGKDLMDCKNIRGRAGLPWEREI